MHLDIITPEKKLFSGEVTSVKVPGTMGEFQVLKNHAPIISSLGKGKVTVKSSEGVKTFDVRSGVIEVLKNNVIVLAES